MDTTVKIKDEDNDSMNFDDNYNEQEFLKQQVQNKKVQKLSIMDGFTELCQKLNYLNDEDKLNQNQNIDTTLAQYYAKCKEKIPENIEKPKIQENPLTPKPNNNKPSPVQKHPIHLLSDNNPLTPNRLQTFQSIHERNLLNGQNNKKPQQIIELQSFENKRNYSSVQEKKKILQPSKNVNQNQALTMKDYFGEENNFVNKKVHGKNFISKDSKTPKQDTPKTNGFRKDTPNPNMQNPKSTNQNSLKESNLISTMKRGQIAQKRKQKLIQKNQKPKIILYKKIIDLSQSTEAIIEAFKIEQMKSDYEILNQSHSGMEEGLFAKAIVHQRATKTVQNVQSPNYNYMQPSYKQNGAQKQYISSPINISYSPNPTNNYKSIFQKREIYR